MADLMLCVFFISITYLHFTTSQGICRPHDIRGVSEGTFGFATEFQIEVLEGQADLQLHSSRQSLIPEIYFNCSGNLTKWVIPAQWVGNNEAYLQLQLWRNSGSNIYNRVGVTDVVVSGENPSKIYEITLNPPLVFQEGDIIGYFQPHSSRAQLNLYLEDSEIVTTYVNRINEDSLSTSSIFSLDNAHFRGEDYPLISFETDPPNCGCGKVTLARINTLLTGDRTGLGPRNFFPQEQVIFPSIGFNNSGVLLSWIIGGTYHGSGQSYAELQLWRPVGPRTYQKLNGTSIVIPAEERTGIYELQAENPLPFQSGDIIGLFQPSFQNSRLLVDYNGGADIRNYFLPLSTSQTLPIHTFVDTTNWMTGSALPLASVVIALDAEVTITSAISPVTTTMLPTPSVETTALYSSQNTISTTIGSMITISSTVRDIAGEPTPTPLDDPTLVPDILQPNSPSSSSKLRGGEPTQVASLPRAMQTTSSPTAVEVNSTSDDNTQGLMFYVSLAIVALLAVMITVLAIVLVFVIKSPRKVLSDKEPTLPAIHVNPDSTDLHYEAYSEENSPVVVSSSLETENSQPVLFDDTIYSSSLSSGIEKGPTATCKLMANLTANNHQNRQVSSVPTVSAYAISNVHCTTHRDVPTIIEPNNDYDYADP